MENELNNIPYGYCHCGCGQKTSFAKQSNTTLGWIKGMPKRFLQFHSNKIARGDLARNWKGGKTDSHGYVCIRAADHPRAHNGYVKEQLLIVEKAMGKSLSSDHPIHHFNEKRDDNSNGNLVVCNDEGYHRILHQRARSYRECGHAHWRKCSFCKQYDDPKNLYISEPNCRHQSCYNLYRRDLYNREREKENVNGHSDL